MLNTVKVTKMQGCGNDFVIIDYNEYEKIRKPMSEVAQILCDRNFGVGADGMIIPKTDCDEADIEWHFYNSDGTTAQMCGNGIRCFSRYVFDKKLVQKKKFSVKTLAGIIIPELLDDGTVRVNMSKPVLQFDKIPYVGSGILTVDGKEFKINPVSMGNPHCVIFTEDNPLELAKKFGPLIEPHKDFPEKTNVEFVKIISRNEIELCVYERGCGITLACGTGACASVTAAVLNNLTDSKVKVNLLGGAVFIDWQGSSDDIEHDIFMTGPCKYTFFADFVL